MTANDQSRKRNRNQVFFRRIVTSWIIVAAVFFAAGGIVTHALCAHITGNQASSGQHGVNSSVELENGKYTVYGAFDDRVFTQEISMDWCAEDTDDFIPISCSLDEEVQEFTYCLCKGYNLDFALVMAMMEHESSFRESVISTTNDYGLMQINQSNHEWLTETIGVTDFLDPYENIRAGCFILRKLFEKYQDTNMVLMAYNMGENRAETLWKNGVYNTSYSDKITSIQSRYYSELGVK